MTDYTSRSRGHSPANVATTSSHHHQARGGGGDGGGGGRSKISNQSYAPGSSTIGGEQPAEDKAIVGAFDFLNTIIQLHVSNFYPCDTFQFGPTGAAGGGGGNVSDFVPAGPRGLQAGLCRYIAYRMFEYINDLRDTGLTDDEQGLRCSDLLRDLHGYIDRGKLDDATEHLLAVYAQGRKLMGLIASQGDEWTFGSWMSAVNLKTEEQQTAKAIVFPALIKGNTVVRKAKSMNGDFEPAHPSGATHSVDRTKLSGGLRPKNAMRSLGKFFGAPNSGAKNGPVSGNVAGGERADPAASTAGVKAATAAASAAYNSQTSNVNGTGNSFNAASLQKDVYGRTQAEVARKPVPSTTTTSRLQEPSPTPASGRQTPDTTPALANEPSGPSLPSHPAANRPSHARKATPALSRTGTAETAPALSRSGSADAAHGLSRSGTSETHHSSPAPVMLLGSGSTALEGLEDTTSKGSNTSASDSDRSGSTAPVPGKGTLAVLNMCIKMLTELRDRLEGRRRKQRQRGREPVLSGKVTGS